MNRDTIRFSFPSFVVCCDAELASSIPVALEDFGGFVALMGELWSSGLYPQTVGHLQTNTVPSILASVFLLIFPWGAPYQRIRVEAWLWLFLVCRGVFEDNAAPGIRRLFIPFRSTVAHELKFQTMSVRAQRVDPHLFRLLRADSAPSRNVL